MAASRKIPAGFSLKSVSTTASGHTYEVEVLQATGEGLEGREVTISPALAAIWEAYEAEGTNPDETLVAIWNSGNEQGAKQGPKNEVRKAVEAGEGVAEAVASHQDSARGFIQGAPRGGGGRSTHESGLTKKQREAFGSAVSLEMARTGKAPTQARITEICEELGINPSQLG